MERKSEFPNEVISNTQKQSIYLSSFYRKVLSHDLGASARQQSHRDTHDTSSDLLQRQGGLTQRSNRRVELGLHVLGEQKFAYQKALGRRHHMLLLKWRLNLASQSVV